MAVEDDLAKLSPKKLEDLLEDFNNHFQVTSSQEGKDSRRRLRRLEEDRGKNDFFQGIEYLSEG